MNPELDISRPLFSQVKEAIENDILAGRLNADEQIPSNSQLVAFFGLNPVTVHKGVSQLTDEGIVYKKRGLGMFVEQNARAILQARRQAAFSSEYIRPLVKQAQTLGMSANEVCKLVKETWTEENK
ncbi:MAG: GntR family transcriptional regulator [Coriobacteriales bacterium]|nr:GntR family transcriptional regulator [Coriobacteriales bacterium]